MRRCGQLGIPYREAISSPFFAAQGLVAPSLAGEHGEGVTGFSLVGGRLRPLDPLRTLPHGFEALRVLLRTSESQSESVLRGDVEEGLRRASPADGAAIPTLPLHSAQYLQASPGSDLHSHPSEETTEDLALESDILDQFEFTPIDDESFSRSPSFVPPNSRDEFWSPSLGRAFPNSEESWGRDLSTPAGIDGEGIVAADDASIEQDDAYLVRSSKGRKSLKRGRRIRGSRVSIEPHACRTWCESIAENGRCSTEEIRALISRCRGNVHSRDLVQNVVRALEDFGLEVGEQRGPQDALWGATCDVDAAELFEAVDAVVNWEIRLPGTGQFVMSRSREDSHLKDLLSSRQLLSQAILSHDGALTVALQRKSHMSQAFMLRQWSEQGSVRHGRLWSQAIEHLEELKLMDPDYDAIIEGAIAEESSIESSFELTRAMDEYHHAVDNLKKHYLPLVRRFVARTARGAEDLEDLFQAAMEGVRRAVQLVTGTSAVRFRVYLAIWVRQSILKWRADHGGLFRFPLNRMTDIDRFVIALRDRRMSRPFRGRRRRFFESGAMAEDLGWSLEQVEQHMSLPLEPVPLRQLDSVTEEHTWVAQQEGDRQELAEAIEALLQTLGEREARILRLYHGMDGEDSMTLEEIGSQLGVTRERVRQIKGRAMEKLLASGAADLLSAYH
jgi:RNA polymerase primary sigma factor